MSDNDQQAEQESDERAVRSWLTDIVEDEPEGAYQGRTYEEVRNAQRTLALLDRQRAELAEIRGMLVDAENDLSRVGGRAWRLCAAGDALADAARLVINGQGTNDALIDLSAKAGRWRSVRGDAPAEAPPDAAPPADQRAILPHDWARREVLFLAREVVRYRGSQLEGAKLDQLAVAITTLDEKVAEHRAARLSAPPADEPSPFEPDGEGGIRYRDEPPAAELPETLSSVDDAAASDGRRHPAHEPVTYLRDRAWTLLPGTDVELYHSGTCPCTRERVWVRHRLADPGPR